ncbi:rbcL, partial [Symbiodinium microadriaticum]
MDAQSYRDHCLIVLGSGLEAEELLLRRRLGAGGRAVHFLTEGPSDARVEISRNRMLEGCFFWHPPTWGPVTDFGSRFGPSEHRYWSHTVPLCHGPAGAGNLGYAMIKETGEGKLSSTKHTTDAPNEMTACDKYIPFPFRVHTNTLSCGKVEHDASGTKHIIHIDIMRLGKVEGDASDKNFAVMQQDVVAKGPNCHEWEGMKQISGIHTDRMGFGKVEGDALYENFAVMQTDVE